MSTSKMFDTVTGNKIELDTSKKACQKFGHLSGEQVDAFSHDIFINWGEIAGVGNGFLWAAFDGHMGRVNSIESMDLKKRLIKKVRVPSGHTLEMNISNHFCEPLGFKHGEAFHVNGLSVDGTVIGVAPLPKGFEVDCVENGAGVLWVTLLKEGGDQVCFFPDPKRELDKVLPGIFEEIKKAQKGC